jgi:hypothetical protein
LFLRLLSFPCGKVTPMSGNVGSSTLLAVASFVVKRDQVASQSHSDSLEPSVVIRYVLSSHRSFKAWYKLKKKIFALCLHCFLCQLSLLPHHVTSLHDCVRASDFTATLFQKRLGPQVDTMSSYVAVEKNHSSPFFRLSLE